MSDFTSPQQTTTTEIQSQPYSREAEEAVLGSVLINPESYFEIAEILNAEDFYIIRNQWIWASFVRLFEKRVPIDILTVSEDLSNHNQLNRNWRSGLPDLAGEPDPNLSACTILFSHRGARLPSAGVCWWQPMNWPSWLMTRKKTWTLSSIKPKCRSLA